MLDTVGFRIHDLDKHRHISDYLEDFDRGITNYGTTLPKDEYSSMMRRKKDVRLDMVKYGLAFNKVKNHSLKSHMMTLNVSSSHFDIQYKIDYIRDFIEFQFSIPKYLHGHNIAQFVTSPYNKNFMSVNPEMKFQKANLYNRFYKFMKMFIMNEFIDMEVDYTYLEITRIDFCFNQYFESKSDALAYLDIQKQIKFNRKRDSANINARPTSLTYLPTGRSHSFKIYHKGSEYQTVGDKKKHIKRNKELLKQGKSKFFDVDYLQQEADKILRYEVTYRSKHFDLRYMTKPSCENNQYNGAFRQKSKVAYKQKLAYNKLKRKDLKGIMLKPNEKAFYRKYKKALNKSHKYFLETKWEVKVHEQSFDKNVFADLYTEATFSKNLFNYLFDEFKQYVNDFQISEMPTIHQVVSKISNHNKKTQIIKNDFKDVYSFLDSSEKSIIPSCKYSAPIVTFLRLLEKYTISEIKNMGIYPKATLYRRLKDLKNLGIYNNNVSGYSTINTDLSFSHYFGEAISSTNKLFSNRYNQDFF